MLLGKLYHVGLMKAPELKASFDTVFILPIKETKLVETIREETQQSHLNNRILLFLKHLRQIEIVDKVQSQKRTIIKAQIRKTNDYEIYETQEFQNDSFSSKENWLLFHSSAEVPKEIKEDFTTKEWERENVARREVVVAFRLDEDGNIVAEKAGTAHIGVFSFLPLKEVPSGLDFLLQADFLTTPGRGDLARDG
jgi:hypothetical protein